MAKETVKLTKSGLFIKADPTIGLLVHSPFTGLTYAVHDSDARLIRKWLDSPTSTPPSDLYRLSMGAGWAAGADEAKHPTPHLLPGADMWPSLPTPHSPILINWFLTGKCPLACLYCYAEDLMRDDDLEPDASDIEKYGAAILRLNPLVVVLTGGDPLFSPHLRLAVQLLSGRVGIVVDTSGYTLTDKHVDLFRRHKVTVRISFDSERPKVNDYQRPIYDGYPPLIARGKSPAEAAIESLGKCLAAGLSVNVQTVATKKTANDLVALGDKLYRLGVGVWRVFKVARSQARIEGYKQLVGAYLDSGKPITGKKARGPYEFVFGEIQSSYMTRWKQRMAVQVTYNDVPNSVILVSPDGIFYTESNVNLAKVVIDDLNPKAPSLEAIHSRVNMLAHAERYLNLTSP
ncbi:MAG TPA: radical SAM protein [Anaerolineales bacterium]|nr:radical SAM protein [Anaerolineales bacterium]